MRSIRILPSAVLALTLVSGAVRSITLEGIDIPQQMGFPTAMLMLNGAGVRSKLFIEVYVACLYLETPGSDPAAIMAANEPQAVTLHIVSDLVTSEKLARAARRDMDRATEGRTGSIQPQIDQFMALFDEQVVKGDVFKLFYQPGAGTHVIKNDRTLGIIPGLAFKRALFGIWLSDNPTQKSLRDRLVGETSGAA